MKRITAFILLLVIIFCFTACTQKTTYEVPVLFYYYNVDISYESEDGVIASETREGSAFANDLNAFINEYIKGPQSDHLRSPFPEGTEIVELKENQDQLFLRVNEKFSTLSGIDLSLAYICLARTLFAVTDAQSIYIYTDGSNGSENLVSLTRSSYLLYDEYHTSSNP